MDELKKQAEHVRVTVLKRKKDRYSLAKELGFTPVECSILAGRSERYIRNLATTRMEALNENITHQKH